MSDPSSTSNQMLTALSEIEPIAVYSPLDVESRSSVPSSSHQDIPENPFHSIDLNSLSIPTGPGPYHEMLPDTLFEGDLPRNKSSGSNILAASEELVIESLAMIREEARAEQNDPLQGEEVRDTQPIFDKTPDFGRYPSSNSSDSESYDEPIQWKVERRDVGVSRKGKEKVVEDVPRRRPTTRSDARKLMADALKPSARSTAEIRRATTFKEIVDNLRTQAGRVFDMGIINLPGIDSLHDMVEIQSWMHLYNRKSPILHEEERHAFYYNIQFKEDESILTRVNDIAVHLDEFLLGKILRVPREGTKSVIGKACSVEFVSLVSNIPTTMCAGVFMKVTKSEYQLVFEFVNKTLLLRTEKRTSATSADFFVMELLCRFGPLNLSELMLEHLYKMVIKRKGIHRMGYGYFLTEVFKHLKIPQSVGRVGTVKQAFSENTLVECECIEGKGDPKRKMTQLIEYKDQLKHEVEKLTVRLSGKDAKITIVKAELLTA
ncbi:hypothetical protein EJD97_001864, partial [Solanum chilense]